MIGKNCKLDPVADPFGERVSDTYSERHSVLGGHFDFVTSRQRLLRLARSAFGGLSTRRFPASTPSLQVHLKLTPESPGSWRDGPPPMQYFAGAGLLGGAMDASNLALIQPSIRHALVCMSPRLLRSHYHARSELLEFAVYTLAAQAGHLAPLHAACIGSGRRGVLIVGNSGTGKSTLAWQCAMLGLDFLSEDSTFVRSSYATGHRSRELRASARKFAAIRGSRRAAQEDPAGPRHSTPQRRSEIRGRLEKIWNSARIGAIGPLRSGVSLAACGADRFAPAACGSRAGHHSIEARAALCGAAAGLEYSCPKPASYTRV